MSERVGSHRREHQPGDLVPSIRVAALADHRTGRDRSYWLFAAVPAHVLRAKVEGIIDRSANPSVRDWLIVDSADFAGYELGVRDEPERLCDVARGIFRQGPAFAAWAHLTRERPDALSQFQTAYCGEFDSPEAWARELLRELVSRSGDEAEVRLLRPFTRADLTDLVFAAEQSGAVCFVPTDDRVWVFRTG